MVVLILHKLVNEETLNIRKNYKNVDKKSIYERILCFRTEIFYRKFNNSILMHISFVSILLLGLLKSCYIVVKEINVRPE